MRAAGGQQSMESIFVGIVALVGGFVFGWKSGANAVVPALSQISNTQAIDRANFLQTLRRELANILVWRNPQRYLSLYRQLHVEAKSLASWRVEEVRTRISELCKKYPNYSDFDAVATREYVLYPDGVSMLDDAEIEERYRDLILFVALSVLADESWKDAAAKMFVHTTSDKELAHLTEYVHRIEDTKLKLRIEQAMDHNAWARRDDARNLDNDFYAIIDLPHFAENRYGVHLKRTNEFGIYSFFVFDDGRISYSFYRSDPTFQQERPLNPLHPVLEELKLAR
jgi:hypothetical protein